MSHACIGMVAKSFWSCPFFLSKIKGWWENTLPKTFSCWASVWSSALSSVTVSDKPGTVHLGQDLFLPFSKSRGWPAENVPVRGIFPENQFPHSFTAELPWGAASHIPVNFTWVNLIDFICVSHAIFWFGSLQPWAALPIIIFNWNKGCATPVLVELSPGGLCAIK